MIAGFFDIIKAFFNRTFWFGAFFPVAIVALVHALLTAFLFPQTLSLDAVIDASATETAGRFMVVFLALIAAAYLISPLLPVFHGLIDGTLLPEWLHDLLRWDRLPGWQKTTTDLRAEARRLFEAEDLASDGRATLKAASEEGSASSAMCTGLIEAAETAAAECGPSRWSRITTDVGAIDRAVQQVAAALRCNTADRRTAEARAAALIARRDAVVAAFVNLAPSDRPPPPAPPSRSFLRGRERSFDSAAIDRAEAAVAALEQSGAGDLDALNAADAAVTEAVARNAGDRNDAAAWARRLDAVHETIDGVLTAAVAERQHRYESLGRRCPSLDLTIWEATRFGDARRHAERYSRNVYRAHFDWLWPRLSLAIPPEDKGPPVQVDNAKAQLDFSVLLLFLSQTVPLVWIPATVIAAHPVWVTLVLGWLWPLINSGLYEVAVRSQMTCGTVIATAIDLYRFELLDKLHQARPQSLEAEQELWKRLQEADGKTRPVNLYYSPSRPAGGSA